MASSDDGNNEHKRKSSSVFNDAKEEGEEDDGSVSPTAKRQRKNNEEDEEDLFATTAKEERSDAAAAVAASSRRAGLSKFVRRILDPHREPRGLIEPPQVIPLNDEFLQAFGKREQKYDQQVGRESNFDQSIVDDNYNNDEDDNAKQKSDEDNDNGEKDREPTKVKVANLLYTTSPATLMEECKNFGQVLEVNMIMDESDPQGLKNVGRAFVLFADAPSAQNCVDQQLGGSLDGRPVRVTLAEDRSKNSSGGNAPGGAGGGARYYQQDISTKCFRCGKVGHMEASCPNPPKASICPLCAKANEHDIRACPLNRVCFNCGIPGHVNRECPVRRGQPPRQICTLCCGSGHNRFACHRSATSIQGINAAICCVCHRVGHFLCQDLKWFFGLEGVFCFNCGAKGHVGHQCQRPNLDDLARNDGWAVKEVDRAEEYKLADEMEAQRAERTHQEREQQRDREQQRQRNRDRHKERDRQNHRNNNNRAKSAPPPRNRGYQDTNRGGGGGGRGGGGRGGGGEYRFNVGNDDGNRRNSSGGNNNNRKRGY